MHRSSFGLPSWSVLLLASIAVPPTAAAEPAPAAAATPGLGKGSFLVASRELIDPNFSRTVVLLLEYADDGAVGLVINRPSHLAVAEVLPDVDGLADSLAPLFVGGPVARERITLLVRAPHKPDEADHITGNIWASASSSLLDEVAGGGRASRRPFRVYSGYAGWGAGQLDREIDSGGWLVLPVDEDAVFAPDPLQVWERMLERSSARWTRRLPPPSTPALR